MHWLTLIARQEIAVSQNNGGFLCPRERDIESVLIEQKPRAAAVARH
jgi:hypothetical protein